MNLDSSFLPYRRNLLDNVGIRISMSSTRSVAQLSEPAVRRWRQFAWQSSSLDAKLAMAGSGCARLRGTQHPRSQFEFTGKHRPKNPVAKVAHFRSSVAELEDFVL